MASIEEVRAGIAMANDKAAESLGALQQARSSIEQAQSALQQVTAGSGQSDVDQANAMYSQAAHSIADVQQSVSAAIRESEGVANRL